MNDILLAALAVGLAAGGMVLSLLALDWVDRFFRNKTLILLIVFILIFVTMYIHNS